MTPPRLRAMSHRLVLALSAASLPALTAHAEAAASAPAPTSVQEIVVTAQRRDEASEKVPISLSVLSGSALAQDAVHGVNQLQNVAPSLEIEPAFGSAQPQFRIRGVGFQDYATNNAPTVGIYLDEVAYPIPIMSQNAFFDIARVEVLRGPQGTLYGRNTTGGAVNIIANQPTADWHEGGELDYGGFHQLHAQAYLSGPLAPGVTSRLAVMTDQGGAYQVDRDTGARLGDVHAYGARWITDFAPDPSWLIKLELHGAFDRSAGQGLYLFTPANDGAGLTAPADANRFATGWGLDPAFAADIGAQPGAAPFRQDTQTGASLQVRKSFAGFDAVNLVSYDWINRRELEDWGALPQEVADVFFRTRAQVIADELRLVSTGSGPLSWIAGIYLSHQAMNEAYLSDFLDIYGVSAGVHYRQVVESAAVFGQVDYRLSPTVKLTGGLRFEDESRRLEDFQSVYLFGTAPVGGLSPSGASTSMTPLTGKAAIEWTPDRSLLAYASVSRGVKSGGFTTYNTSSVQGISPFAPEKLWAFETGYKWAITPRLRLNGSAFYYDYADQQVLSALYTPAQSGQPPVIIGHFVNAPRSHIEGFEAQLEGEILPGLTLSQQVGWKEGAYDRFTQFDLAAYEETGATGVVDEAGRQIPFPHWSYEGAIAGSAPIGGRYRLEPQLDYSFHPRSPSWLGATFDLPAYWLVNLNLTVTPEDRRWSVGLFVHNLTNAQYDLTRNFFVPGVNVADPGRPRSVGVRLTADL